MRRTLRTLSLLLGYPSEELQAHVGELRAALDDERALPAARRRALEPLLQSLATSDLLDAQADYSELFDRSRHLSLHLFEHVHGDSRERGPAMIDLGQLYIDHGYAMAGNELPDYLPLFLEFASCLPADEARDLLAQPAHVYAALEERLLQHDSPYAAVFGALLTLAGASPDADALAELRARQAEAKSLDEEWEDAPVEFGKPTLDAKQATGIVARIRAAQQSVVAAIKG